MEVLATARANLKPDPMLDPIHAVVLLMHDEEAKYACLLCSCVHAFSCAFVAMNAQSFFDCTKYDVDAVSLEEILYTARV